MPAWAENDLAIVSAAQALAAEELVTNKTVPVYSVTNWSSLGTYWSLQLPLYPPIPWTPFPDLSVIVVDSTNNIYMYDDRSVDYPALWEQLSEQAEDEASVTEESGNLFSMMTSSLLNSAYAYGNPVFLTNLVAASSGSSMIAHFSITGGTNFVPYDILMSTYVANSVSQWTWLGIGYTSYRYTFSNQPFDQAYYILAKPSKTMVVGWGRDTLSQCDVPFGISNVVAIAGAHSHSLALLNNGTIVTWGDTNSAPTNLVGVTMIAAGWNHDVAVTNGHVVAWGGGNLFGEINVPSGLTNVVVVSAQALNTLALRGDGTVVAWGDNSLGQTNVPAGLTNVSAIAAGGRHSLAVSNGFVVAWGNNDFHQCDVPAGLSNVWDVAAGWEHSVALKRDGTIVCWGDNSFGETNVPAGLSNVVAIAAGSGKPFDDSAYTLALKSDGTLVAWGSSEVLGPVDGLTNVILIEAGTDHALAVRTGPRTPVITLEPTDQYQLAGGSVTFRTRGLGLAGVHYQWQFYGTNLNNATNTTLTLTNVQTANQGTYRAVVGDSNGSIASSNVTFTVVTPPIIVSQTLPTNQVVIYGNYLYFSVTASAHGQIDGFPIGYQWQSHGTNIPGANTSSYGFAADDTSSGIYSVIVTNAAGSTTATWWVTVTNVVNVTNDLLIIYNTNSPDSIFVKNYYLAHRPMVGGANVLGIGCTNWHSILPEDYTNNIAVPVQNWLAANPTKRPQYVILMAGIPWRVNTNAASPFGVYYGNVPGGPQPAHPSMQYQFRYFCATNWQPFVTSINMGELMTVGGVDYPIYTNACKAYIDKLEFFGTNCSSGQLVISANACPGGYGNTNYVVDSVRHGASYTNDNHSGSTKVSATTNGLVASGVATSAIIFADGLDETTNGIRYDGPHVTNAVNVAGYISWGAHSSLDNEYAHYKVKWQGASAWWIVETVESFNGQPAAGQGDFWMWFADWAFGGTNFSNTPVGAVTHVDEPFEPGVNDSSKYFGLWISGKNFGICAWNSRNTDKFQAVGDPFVIR